MAHVPQSYLDTTPTGMTAQEIIDFRKDRDIRLGQEICTTPPIDPNNPNSATDIANFQANKALVLTALMNRTTTARAAIMAAGAGAPAAGAGAPAAAAPPAAAGVPAGGGIPAAGAAVAIIRPQCGGISTNFGMEMAWTGGGRLVTTARDNPKSVLSYRPRDFKEHARIVKECQAGLADEHRLGTPTEIFKETGVTFRLWNQKVKAELEERGMDGPFHVVNGATETFLLDDFGQADHVRVTTWVDGLRAAPCPYEGQNLMMSAKFLLASIKVELLEMVERNVRENASGPEVYTAIVNLHQRVSTSAVRKLVETLMKMSLKDEPGENVPVFIGKVSDIAKRILGTGSPPNDIVALIYKAFTKCTVETFRMTANTYYEGADANDPTYNNWEARLLVLDSRYRRDVDNGDWEPIKHLKESAAMSGTLSATGDTRTCYHCGKPGHIKPNCPDKDKPSINGASMGSSAGGANRSVYRTPPEEGMPHVKLIEGASHSWCAICKRWNTGKKAHVTTEHKKRGEKVEVAPVVVAVTAPGVGAVASVVPPTVGNVGTIDGTSVIGSQHFGGYVGTVSAPEPFCLPTVDCWVELDSESVDRDGDLDLTEDDPVSASEEAVVLPVVPEEATPTHVVPEEASLSHEKWHLNCRAGRR